ncbi:MAG: zf-TFIIB domain-containing protein [Limisphaerales bacterium]
MAPETLSCPQCGAVVASEAAHCEHCGARLATVACPSCFGMMFIGQQYCPHCGAKAARQDSDETSEPEPCPRCQNMMEAVVLGDTKVRECPRCEGIWTDADTLRQICASREQQSAVLGMASHLPSNDGVAIEKHIRYLPCPICHKLMNRVNFANCSGVIVDVCLAHGTWFDRDELRRIVEFIRGGGLEKSRVKEMEDLEEARHRAAAAQVPIEHNPTIFGEDIRYGAVSAVARVVLDLLAKR